MFVVICSDNILVHTKNQKDHEDHLSQIFNTLNEQKLYANLKCEFFADNIASPGYMLSNEGIKMDPRKMKAIISWLEPNIIKKKFEIFMA